MYQQHLFHPLNRHCTVYHLLLATRNAVLLVCRVTHWINAFIKQVLPKFFKPHPTFAASDTNENNGSDIDIGIVCRRLGVGSWLSFSSGDRLDRLVLDLFVWRRAFCGVVLTSFDGDNEVSTSILHSIFEDELMWNQLLNVGGYLMRNRL
eukprot:527469_1